MAYIRTCVQNLGEIRRPVRNNCPSSLIIDGQWAKYRVSESDLSFFILLYYTGITLHRYHARLCGFRSGVTRTIENVVLLLS